MAALPPSPGLPLDRIRLRLLLPRGKPGQDLHLNRAMLSHQRWPYVGRFARDWHRLPGNIPGQPQTRTRAHPRIGRLPSAPQRTPAGQGTSGGHRMDLPGPRAAQGLGGGAERGARREHIIDQQDPGRHVVDRPERPAHGRASLGPGTSSLWIGGDRAPQQPRRRQVEAVRQRDGQRARLVVPAFGTPTSCEGHPRDHVGRGRRAHRGHRIGHRRRDIAPSRELQPVHGAPRGAVVDEGRTCRIERRWTGSRGTPGPQGWRGCRSARTTAAQEAGAPARTTSRTATHRRRSRRSRVDRRRRARDPTCRDPRGRHRHAYGRETSTGVSSGSAIARRSSPRSAG